MAEVDDSMSNELSYEEKVSRASIIAKPMASKKLAKKLFKLIRKGIHERLQLKRIYSLVVLIKV